MDIEEMKIAKFCNREFLIVETGTNIVPYNMVEYINPKYSVFETNGPNISRVTIGNTIDECMDNIVNFCENGQWFTVKYF